MFSELNAQMQRQGRRNRFSVERLTVTNLPWRRLAVTLPLVFSAGCDRIFGSRPEAPAQVTALQVADVSVGGATLQWNQVSNGAGRPADYLVVVGSPAPAFTPSLTSGFRFSGTEIGAPMIAVVDGLEGAKLYTAYVVSYRQTDDSIFFSPPSVPVSFTPAALSPQPVTDVTVESVGQTTASIRWTQVDNGVGAPSNYLIYYASPTATWPTDQGLTKEVIGTAVGQPASYSASDLLPGTTYQFFVRSLRGRRGAPDSELGASGAPVALTTEPPPPTGPIESFTPNRPAGLQTIAEVLFSSPSDLTNTGSRGSAAGVTDESAPQSPPLVARFNYPIGDAAGYYTGSRAFNVPAGTVRVYFAYNWKMSPEFTLHPANLKVWYFYRGGTNGGSLVIGHDPHLAAGNLTTGRFVINGIPQTAGGPGIMRPNVVGAPTLMRGVWYHTEVLAVMNTSPTVSDGKLRVWVNGILTISNDNVRYSENTQPLEWRQVNLDPYYGGNTPGHTIQTLSTFSVDHVILATGTSR